jgi:tRNA-dihydrouridine synthase A
MRPYIEAELARGTRLKNIVRHLLGLYHGQPGGRAFRRVLSEQAHRDDAGWETVESALEAVRSQPAKAA